MSALIDFIRDLSSGCPGINCKHIIHWVLLTALCLAFRNHKNKKSCQIPICYPVSSVEQKLQNLHPIQRLD